MNELAYHYKDLMLSGGGVHGADFPGIIKHLNRMPMATKDYQYATEVLMKQLEPRK